MSITTSHDVIDDVVQIRHRATLLALSTALGLTLLKWFTAEFSQSVGVLSESIHSFLDLISAVVSFFTVRVAVKPADEDHPFGHGKIETLSSLFEAVLLLFAALLIFYEGFLHWKNPQPLKSPEWTWLALLFSIVLSYGVYRHNLKAAQLTESQALHVNAVHFFSDVLSSLGILLGLMLMQWTGWLWIDPVIAFCVAIYILFIALQQVKKSLWELTDTHLPPSEVDLIRSILQKAGGWIGVHALRTRKSGSMRHIDFHLVVCGHLSVHDSHAMCDQLESQIQSVLERASIHIHVEPCEQKKVKSCHLCPYHPT